MACLEKGSSGQGLQTGAAVRHSGKPMVYCSDVIHLFLLMILRGFLSPQASQGYWILMQERLETSRLDTQLDAQNKIPGAGNAPRQVQNEELLCKMLETGHSHEGVMLDRLFSPERVF